MAWKGENQNGEVHQFLTDGNAFFYVETSIGTGGLLG